MASCIYCPDENFREEHPLPAGLGKFKDYVTLDDRICQTCNGKCGCLDEQLCRSGPEAFFRIFLGIKGRKNHEKVKSFYRGSAGGSPLEMLGTNQDTGANVLLELVSDTEVRELRCLQLFTDDSSPARIIRIKDGMAPAEFRKEFDKFGIKRFAKAMAYAAPDEREWVESLIGTMTCERRDEWRAPSTGPTVYGPSVIKFEMTSRYFREIAKIGFHYFLTRMPHFRGDEACFTDIRNFIVTDRCPVTECRRFVTYRAEHLAWQLQGGASPSAWGHFLCAEADYLNLTASVELFAGPGKRPLSYVVHLGKNPSRLDYGEAYGDFFAYLPKEERGVFDGVRSPMTVLAARPEVRIPILPRPVLDLSIFLL